MNRVFSSLGPWMGTGVFLAVAAFLVAGSGVLPGTVVYADSIIGPNLMVTSPPTGDLFSNSGGGGCGGGALNVTTVTLDTSATNPGVTVTRSIPCLETFSSAGPPVSKTGSIGLAALNGYQIEDISASFACGVTGGLSLSITFNSLTLNCPSELTPDALGLVSGHTTFSPTTTLTDTITLSGSAVSAGSFTFKTISENFSLLAPTPVPEPSTLSLLFPGLVGLAALLRKQFLRR
jgi:hypothetical protein